MRRLLFALLLFAFAATDAGASRVIAGPVSHVRDGDTIVVAGLVVRLLGVHAPELREPGGPEARVWMLVRTQGRHVVCRPTGTRSHGRLVAVCHDHDGDLAAQLIEAGLGRDCPRFSGGRYIGRETDAGRRLRLPVYCLPRSGGAAS